MVITPPGYRHDEATPPPDDVRTYLDRHYFAQLPNLNVVHPKLLVVFSGGNAVGKSTLSLAIQKQLGALVIENDAIKTALLKYDPRLGTSDDFGQLGNITWRYGLELYQRLDTLTPNGFVVRDAVIDWYFDRILPLFEQNGYKLFVIRFDLSRSKRSELIRARGGKAWISTERLESMLDEHDKHSKRFLADHHPDIVLEDEDMFDHDKVIDALRIELELLSS